MNANSVIRMTAVCAAVMMLTACGQIAKQTTSEATMLDKAEMATGIDASKLTVVKDSVTASVDALNYKVRAKNGATYRCYFTTSFGFTSDAICTPLDKAAKANQKKKQKDNAGNCNALLRAAGRC